MKHKSNNLSIFFWNKEGLTEDLRNETELKTTFKSDIIAFTESWTTAESKLTVTGYVVEQSIRSSQNQNSRRSSGGTVVYIKSEISQGIEFMQSEHDDILWLKLSKTFFNLDNDLFIAVVYVIPENSTSMKLDLITQKSMKFLKNFLYKGIH